jgi:tellurite resistance protein TerC
VEGRRRALEFVTGYIVEYSLSVDNLFVFLLVFRFFKVPREAQEAVLFWGILGAMVLRGVMIVLGKALTLRFAWVTFGFAALLLYSAGKLLWGEEDDDGDDLENNKIVRAVRRLLPVHDHYFGDRFFVVDDGKLYATPLMVVLVTVELSDVVFAMDSVPAVLGVSSDPVVIYASNMFAVMGLRSLFFVISDAISNLRFLRQSLAVVLGFVGVKMLASLAGHEFDVVLSLAVIVGTLLLGVGLSYVFPPPAPPPAYHDPESQLVHLAHSQSAGDCALPHAAP